MDRRVKYTKKVIKETFIDLLQEKDINKISVSELCQKCDINRATFYRYYIDIYDLLEKIEQELIDKLKQMLLTYKNYSIKDLVKEYLKVVLENKELIRILFTNSKNLNFLNEFIEYFYENCKLKLFDGLYYQNEEEKNLDTIFVVNGTLGIIYYWVENDFSEDIDDLANEINRISYFGLSKYKSSLLK